MASRPYLISALGAACPGRQDGKPSTPVPQTAPAAVAPTRARRS